MAARHLEVLVYVHQLSGSGDHQELKIIMEEKWGGERCPGVVTLDGRVDQRCQL